MNKKIKIQEDQYNFPYHYLDLYVDEYREIRNLDYLYRLSQVRELLSPLAKKTVLDAGCGDGRFCYLIKQSTQKVVGVDFSQQAILFAKAFNPHVTLHASNLSTLSLNQKFDAIVLLETLEHIPPQKIKKILQRLYTHLKTKGQLIISVPTPNQPLNKKHFQHFTSNKLADLCQQYFEVKKVICYNPIGLRGKLLTLLKQIAILAYPLKDRLAIASQLVKLHAWYYHKHCTRVNPAIAQNIIVSFIAKRGILV